MIACGENQVAPDERDGPLTGAGRFILGATLITENLIDRLNAKAAALMARPPVQPSRDFPLVLREEWRTDRPNPKLGRLRALAMIATRRKTERPAPYGLAAE